jgi:GntP family gluconate:H+ symporter
MDASWITLIVLLTGVAVVVGGILLFRLHAFLALILGALIVGGLTSESLYLQNNALPIRQAGDGAGG